MIAGGAMALNLFAFQRDVGIAWASGVAALVIGVLSFFAANRVRVPALVLVTAAIVPLLPGLSIYRGLALFGQGGSAGLEAIALAAAIAIALSAGVILGQYIAQPLKREAQPPRAAHRRSAPGRADLGAVGPRGALGARPSRRRRQRPNR